MKFPIFLISLKLENNFCLSTLIVDTKGNSNLV